MYHLLNVNLGDVCQVEEDVGNDGEPEQDRRGYHEQEGVHVGLARWPGRRDADGLEDEVLGDVAVSRCRRSRWRFRRIVSYHCCDVPCPRRVWASHLWCCQLEL